VIKVTTKRSYYEQLLNSAFSTKDISFINQFFSQSLTRLSAFGKSISFGSTGAEVKKRIIMLQRSRSNTTAKIKYLALLPITLLMLSFVAYSGTGIKVMGDKETEIPATEEALIGQQLDMPFAVVDQIPLYPGCDEVTGDAARECFSKNLKDYVLRNFNTNTVKPYLKEGSNRIILVFTIGANGEVTGVKSRMVTPGIPVEDKAEIEKEANRVAQTIPKMKPGMHDGKSVGVSYSLPMEIFNTGEVE
jgi:bla regulator protein blaR1